MSEEPRVSGIVKTISRKFNTAKYETLEVSVTFEEKVEWVSLKERQDKLDNITKLLLNDFEKTRKEVFSTLGLKETKSSTSNAVKQDKKEVSKELGFDILEQ